MFAKTLPDQLLMSNHRKGVDLAFFFSNLDGVEFLCYAKNTLFLQYSISIPIHILIHIYNCIGIRYKE